MVGNFLQKVGEEALRTWPLLPALALVFALIAVYLIYDGVITADPREQREKVMLGLAMLVAGVGILTWMWNETAEGCRKARNTEFWTENKCHIVDPEGRPNPLPDFDPDPDGAPEIDLTP